MTDGFRFLETGNYKEAQTFFYEILRNYPTDKTARLCYGRALGLNGHTLKSKQLFINLKADYPNDYEVLLNYAESLLWNTNFHEAKKIYQDLIRKDSTSFPAILGYANTLSNLKKYDQALQYIDTALEIKPSNQNAMVSKKYIKLGKATQSLSKQKYATAIQLLEENLIDFPNDADTQISLANVYINMSDYDNANAIYYKLKDRINSLKGLSLVAHLEKNDKEALKLAQEATALPTIDSLQYITTQERYIQALIWNGKYKTATLHIKTLSNQLGADHIITALKASKAMYTGQISKGIDYYKTILNKDSLSFNGNLGIANAYRGQENLTKAYTYGEKTLAIYPEQKDAIALLKSIDNALLPSGRTTGAYTRDNGGNKAYGTHINATFPFSDRLTTNINYSYRTTENVNIENMATNTNASIGIRYRVKDNTWIENTIGFTKAIADVNNYTDINGSLFIKAKPFPLQNLELGYQRELQNFNATLIDKKIFMNNYMLNYNMGTTINLGWYTGLMHTAQTDKNYRNLIFTSVYYTFTKTPAFKAGFNYQYLSYKKQIPNQYFSPSKYQAVETFLELNGHKANWTYHTNLAVGYQFVEKDDATTLLRAEGKLIYNISKRFQTGAYGKYSNIASATASGFEFTEVGFSLRLQLTKKKLFKF
jgi:tetratricopeptide (TPR) repeat protein